MCVIFPDACSSSTTPHEVGDEVTKDEPLTTNPNVGGFGQAPWESHPIRQFFCCPWNKQIPMLFGNKGIIRHANLCNVRIYLGGGFKHFYFQPYLGKWSNLTNIVQMGGNYQPVTHEESHGGTIYDLNPTRKRRNASCRTWIVSMPTAPLLSPASLLSLASSWRSCLAEKFPKGTVKPIRKGQLTFDLTEKGYAVLMFDDMIDSAKPDGWGT